jgi:hypothetical protein
MAVRVYMFCAGRGKVESNSLIRFFSLVVQCSADIVYQSS